MTLVLTEVSGVGIAMAADSAITRYFKGKVVEVDQQGWSKLLHVPSISAGISYWGMIGALTPTQFDTWLRRVIKSGSYSDLPSFADCLADALNHACHGKPLAEGQDVGIHVAGYSEWSDGVKRPVFFHVHNGNARMLVHNKKDEGGRVVAVHREWVSEPRKLFEKHQDFPMRAISLEENLAFLQRGYLTRNGQYFLYAIISEHLSQAFKYINLIPKVSIPGDPSRLGSRKGFLHTMLDIMIQIYRCSNQWRTVGGTVTSLAIGPGGRLPSPRLTSRLRNGCCIVVRSEES